MQRLPFILAFFFALTAHAGLYDKPKKFGAGVMLGEPTALTFEYRHDTFLYNFAMGYSLHNEVTIIGDYKVLFPNFFPKIIRKNSAPITAFAGIGGFMRFENDEDDNDLGAGVRVPFGFEWILTDKPLGFFLEFAPSYKIVTETDLDLMAAIGGRYYF